MAATITIPCRNGEKNVQQALDELLLQIRRAEGDQLTGELVLTLPFKQGASMPAKMTCGKLLPKSDN